MEGRVVAWRQPPACRRPAVHSNACPFGCIYVLAANWPAISFTTAGLLLAAAPAVGRLSGMHAPAHLACTGALRCALLRYAVGMHAPAQGIGAAMRCAALRCANGSPPAERTNSHPSRFPPFKSPTPSACCPP